ncbi:MAG: AAA family ATPase [Spirochaetales bacterium]|nr:AAA family ATPase [Spirochaetales bacterium]
MQNPTAEQGKYFILSFNFSEVLKDKDKVQDDFNNYCSIKIDSFIKRYSEFFEKEAVARILREEVAHVKLQLLSESLKNSSNKIYLMIDEYDNFAN